MSALLSGSELLKKLSPISEKHALVITIKGYGPVTTNDTLDLRELPDLKPLEGILAGYQSSFGGLDEAPLDVGQIDMQPLRESALALFHGTCGVFNLGEVVSLLEEIQKGDRVRSLADQALIVAERRFGFGAITDGPGDDCAEIVAELKAEIKNLRAENTALRQQLAELPALRLQIEQLKDALVARDNQILELKARINQMIESAKRTPDDFASAVSDSVDKLQSKLSGLPNKVSDFVVREFSLDAKVYVDVNEQGQIDYRFIRPGDNVDPLKVSNLSLKLAPVPKPEEDQPPEEPTPTPPPAPTDSATRPGHDLPIETLTGEDAAVRERLRRNQINSVADFLQVATRARTLAAFSAMLEIDRQRLGNWVLQAQLMTVQGIQAEMARALIDFGVTGLEALAAADAAALLAQYNAQAPDRSLSPVTLTDVQGWIRQAQAYMRL